MSIAKIVAVPLLLALASLTACDIYDDPADLPAEGGEAGNSFAYVDARDYKQWVYLNLSEGTSVTLDYTDTDNIPSDWTFALHRYDCKTNGGAVLATPFSSIDQLLDAIDDGSYPRPANEEFTPDSQGDIIIDVSHMIEGYLVYDTATINTVLTSWLNVDISDMPPIYTPSGKVYLIRQADGTLAAVRFTGFSNPYAYDAKGYISFDFLCPIDF